MERIILKDNFLINSGDNSNQYFVVDESTTEIKIPEKMSCNILFLVKPRSNEIHIEIGRNSLVLISLLLKENFDGFKIFADLLANSKVDFYMADFSREKEQFNFEANLLESGASINWHLASLTAEKDNKKFDISVNHIAPDTYARMDNYGVCKDEGKLLFSGISFIKNGSKKSKTHQNSRIMVFDHLSNGIAKPILKIDENDIEASHAAVVGKINDDHLFYLTSRGLSESAAKELITFGYLKPIINGFIEEELKEEISSLIEGRM